MWFIWGGSFISLYNNPKESYQAQSSVDYSVARKDAQSNLL